MRPLVSIWGRGVDRLVQALGKRMNNEKGMNIR